MLWVLIGNASLRCTQSEPQKCSYSECSKISNIFFFSNEMLLIRSGMHKMFVRIENREDPDQTASSEAV